MENGRNFLLFSMEDKHSLQGKASLASPSFSWAWHSSARACFLFSHLKKVFCVKFLGKENKIYLTWKFNKALKVNYSYLGPLLAATYYKWTYSKVFLERLLPPFITWNRIWLDLILLYFQLLVTYLISDNFNILMT